MANFEWETPNSFFDTLNAEFAFTLDVCATSSNAKCERFYSMEDDGLSKAWGGTCWMNPPYTSNIASWMRKAYEEAQSGCTVVCLIRAKATDTRWWHDYAMKASELRFVKKRISFGQGGKFSGPGTFPSVVLVFRPYCQGPPVVSSIDNRGHPI